VELWTLLRNTSDKILDHSSCSGAMDKCEFHLEWWNTAFHIQSKTAVNVHLPFTSGLKVTYIRKAALNYF